MKFSVSSRSKTLVLFICLHAAIPARAILGKYPVKNFTPTEYKAGIQNIDFAQNRDMNLFVANNLGVLSYNGDEWETHDFQTGKKKRSLAFDEKLNRLYVGSQGEFGYFEQDWNYVSLTTNLPVTTQNFDEVWDVFIFNSNVYFCTFQGIYVFDGHSVSVISFAGGLQRSFSAKSKLFTQSKQGEIMEVDGTKLVTSLVQNQTNQIIAGVIPKDQGYLLFYNSGIIEYSTTFGAVKIYKDLANALQGKYINHVLQLSDTRLVISTQTSGIFLFDLEKETFETISADDGLQTNACLRSFQDYSGNLWVGMQNGLALIDINSPLRLINQKINIQGSGYDAYETEAGTYYTTSNGIYFLANNASQCMFLQETEGPAYALQNINGKLYAGHHKGLFLLEGTKAKFLASMDGLWQVKQLVTKPGYAIGGTYSGLHLFKLNEKEELIPVQIIKGFNESSRFFEEDQKGRIWVGQFYKGLYQLSLSDELTEITNIKNVSNEYDLPIKELIILSKINNELYLGSKKGVYKVDQTTGRIIKAEIFSEVIGEQQVYLLAQGHKKNIHVYTENLVGLFKPISANNYTFVRSSLYQMRFNFNNDLLNVSVNTKEGVLYNANEGFIHYVPELEEYGPMKMPLVLSQVISVVEDSVLYARKPFEKKSNSVEKIFASHKAKVLQFKVESFQFKELDNHRFRYFLKGFDDDYGEWTGNTSKEYTNLEAGSYQFVVQKQNYLGDIVEGQPTLLIIKPPFHRSFLAKALYVLVMIFTLVMAFRFQRRRYKRKAYKLEETKQHELAEKRQELLKLKEEKMENELLHVNNLLAASTMNLVVKNEFMETTKKELEKVKKSAHTSETTRALEKIVKEIDATLRLQEDWKQFEHHFDKVHGDFLSRLRDEFHDLTPSEQKLCAFLRLNMNTKEVANLMGISLRGVEVARYRLRKKLGLSKWQNLSKYILEY